MTGNALNVLYPTLGPATEGPSVGVWNFELTRSQTVERIAAAEPLQNDYRGLTFTAEAGNAVVFYYLPPNGCLWMLDPSDAANEYLPFENRELVRQSNLERIAEQNDSYVPPTHIFGNEPERNWCYYFEKADLALQKGDYQEVIGLMDEAQQRGFEPNYGIEWLPLIQAYVHTDQLDQALELSKRVHGMHSRNDPMLCATWDTLANEIASVEIGDAAAHVRVLASCQPE
jgi:hypothetical protein